jgi:hypothetical protein
VHGVAAGHDQSPYVEAHEILRLGVGSGTLAPSIVPFAPIVSDALACAMAEIANASGALRQSEPTLEPWRPTSETRGEKRYLPVLIMVGAIWIAALLGLSGVTGAILYLFG